MQRTALAAFIVLSACTLQARAQAEPDTDKYDGRWTVTFPNDPKAKVQAADLKLANFAGNWHDLRKLKLDKHCTGKNYPITVQVTQAAELSFTVWGANMKPPCPDLTVTVKPTANPKVLEGSLSTGEPIRLTRR
jgi:hypothetical protein